MTKIDLKQTRKALYTGKPGIFSLIDVPKLPYLMIDGEGDPNTAPEYAAAVEALYSLSYTLKFKCKQAGQDYTVAPLEGLWWSDDLDSFIRREKTAWSWTMMIPQPDMITAQMVDEAREFVTTKKKIDLSRVRFEHWEEGLCVQTLHIGSYDDEGPTIAALHNDFLPANGLTENGHHHEIYLGDPRKTAPEKLKTLLRQPVRRL